MMTIGPHLRRSQIAFAPEIISLGVARLGHLSRFRLKIKLFLMIIKIFCNFSPPSPDFKGKALVKIALTGSRKRR